MKLIRHKLSLFCLWLAHKLEPAFIETLTEQATQEEVKTPETEVTPQ